jgi:tetratricopeptide (TPR) repeat protein
VALAALAAGQQLGTRRRPSPVTTPVASSSAGAPQAPANDRLREVLSLVEHLAQRPGDQSARYRLAELYFQLEDYPRSLAELRRLQRARPKDPKILLRQAIVHRSAGETAQAEAAARRALALAPRFEPAWEWLGQILLDQERAHEALAVFDRCLKRRPNAYFALLGKGRALEQQLLSRHPIPLSAVVQPVRKAVEVDPENAEGLTTLARMTFTYEDRLDEAEELARRAAARAPGSAAPLLLLAQIALARPTAPEHLRRAGEYAYQAGLRAPEDPRPPYLVGRTLLQQGDIARAVKALERSVALGPTPEAVSQLAAACRRAGDAARAGHYAAIYQRYTDLLGRRNALLAAREREPQQARHTYALAEIYLEAGQPETAEQWLREARQVAPHDRRGEEIAARLRRHRQKPHDAPLLPIP